MQRRHAVTRRSPPQSAKQRWRRKPAVGLRAPSLFKIFLRGHPHQTVWSCPDLTRRHAWDCQKGQTHDDFSESLINLTNGPTETISPHGVGVTLAASCLRLRFSCRQSSLTDLFLRLNSETGEPEAFLHRVVKVCNNLGANTPPEASLDRHLSKTFTMTVRSTSK